MNVRQAFYWAVEVLKRQGINSPRLDAEVLLAHVLEISRAQLYAQFHRGLKPTQLEAYRGWVERRAEHEPVAYILGYKEFYGLDFYVDGRVLIPRPETELLVEKALEIAAGTLADIGTGSGAIAVSLAFHLPKALVYATDISEEALVVADLNCRRHAVQGRVRLLKGDLLAPLPESVDLIVANLPYVSKAEFDELSLDIVAYEPRLALDGGPDGLTHIRRFLAQAGRYLRPRGSLLLEIGAGQSPAVGGLVTRYLPGSKMEVIEDYAGLERVVIVRTNPVQAGA